MIEKQILPSRQLGYTRLYLDFLAGAGAARSFYSSRTIEQTAQLLDQVPVPKGQMAAILRRQNEIYRSSQSTFAAVDKLLDPRTVCIFGGQQAGLFGGPMMTLLKALAVAKAARALSEQLNRSVVPIFWIAGDDHDFDEANHTFLLDRQGSLCRIEYAARPSVRLPIGQVQFGDSAALDASLATVRETLGETEFTGELYDLLGRSYTTGDTFVTAFGKLMAAFTAEYGLILFSPNDADVKTLARPFFRSVIEKQDELHRFLTQRNQAVLSARYHLQVQKQDEAVHLFVDLDGRKPVHRNGDRFTVGDRAFAKSELLELLETEPERFSPDVITRPLLQSWLFPVAVQMGGPSEIAYFAQGNVLFDLFERPLPIHLARPTLILVEKRHAKLIDEFGIVFEEIAGDIEQLVNRILSSNFPEDIETRYEQLRSDIRSQIDNFSEKSLGFDPSLREFANQTFGKIDFALKTFEGKLFSAHKKRSTDMREKIYRLQTALHPNNAFQDRSLNIANFIARYGFGVVSWLYESLDPFAPGPKMISMSEEKAK